MTAVDVHMFSWFELVAQVEVRNFMGNCKALTVGRITFLNSNDCGVAFADQQPGNIISQVKMNNFQAQPLRNLLNVYRWLFASESLGEGFALISCCP